VNGETVQPAIRRLLRDTIDSLEKLEVVVALVRSPAPTTVAALASALSLPEGNVFEALTGLERAGVVNRLGLDGAQLSYNSGTDNAATIADLVALYEEDRALVLRSISYLALDRVRSQAARLFADAFVFTNRKKGDPDG